MPLFAWVLLLAAPIQAEDRFVHFLGGVPVGEIRLIQNGAQYTYLSQHFFRSGLGAVERFVAPKSDTLWASQSLLQARPAGCWAVEDEVTRQKGEACITQAGETAKGTLLGQPFIAHYQGGALQQLELGDSRFSRRVGPVVFADPFAEGLAITGNGNALDLVPSLEGARRATPTPGGENPDCLAAAHAWVKEHSGYEVVLGLIDDGRLGWPHAWVIDRARRDERDPSYPPHASPTTRYLALPKEQAAGIYLDLRAHRRTLRRVPAP